MEQDQSRARACSDTGASLLKDKCENSCEDKCGSGLKRLVDSKENHFHRGASKEVRRRMKKVKD